MMALRGGERLFGFTGSRLVERCSATSCISYVLDRVPSVPLGNDGSELGHLVTIHRVNIIERFDRHLSTSVSKENTKPHIDCKVQQTSRIQKKPQYHHVRLSLASFQAKPVNQSIHHNPLLINCDTCLYSIIAPPSNATNSNMLNTTFSRLLSTAQKNSFGSGVPIDNEDDDDKTLSSATKGMKTVKINTCGELYDELCETRPALFSSAPKGRGIDFEVQYYDSLDYLPAQGCSNAPVVCLLHGAPGHYEDFSAQIKYLTSKGVRVLAPNFPDYSATYDHSFRHSPRERLDYLLKFLDAINVHSIDMLAGHSSAVFTMFELLDQALNGKTDRKLQVKSLGLLSTPSHDLPPNMAATPFRLFTLKLFDYPILRPVIIALIHIFVKIQGIQNRVDKNKIENLLIAASAVGYSESKRMSERIKLVQQFKIPTYVAFGCNDRLLPMRCFEQLKRDLGVKNTGQVRLYNHNGELTQDVNKPNELIAVSQFASGGHYTFQKYSKQVNEDMYNFLRHKVLPSKEETTKL